MWTTTCRALAQDRWLAATWIALLVAAVYASGKATPWLYPTAGQRTTAAEAINASPGVVALYGPILDVHSLGELSMTKMTVLYAVFVAALCVVVVRSQIRDIDDGPDQSGNTNLIAAMVEGATLAVLLGALGAAANVAAGLPFAGSTVFGASWAGIGVVATTLTAAAYQLSSDLRIGGAITAAAISLLFALRAMGDSLSATWLSWLSPFGWATRVEAWSTPRWWVLGLYVVASVGLGALALQLNAKRGPRTEVKVRNSEDGSLIPDARTPLSGVLHRNRMTLGLWTAAAAGLAVYFGTIASHFGALLVSPNAREVVQRLGGTGPLRDVLIGAQFSIVAVVVTAFGISVLHREIKDGMTRETAAVADGTHSRALLAAISVAVAGSTWLLFVIGTMFTFGRLSTGGSVTAAYIAASLNHAPAVWTIVAMAAVAWSLRPAWAFAGWALLIVFTALGPVASMMALPASLVDLSPYSRVAPMPAETFDWTSTVALTVSSCVLLAVAVYDSRRRRPEWPQDTAARRSSRHGSAAPTERSIRAK